MDSDKLLQITVGLIVLFLAWQFWQANCQSNLDNRPRWMMGGLRDDTGSHNAKDVFGNGFGLDQTRKGVATVDGVYNVKLGESSRQLGGKLQTEYGSVLGDPQVAHFLDRKNKSPFAAPNPKGFWSKLKAKANALKSNKNERAHSNPAVNKMQEQIEKAKQLVAQTPAVSTFLSRPKPPMHNMKSQFKQHFAAKPAPSTTEEYLASQLH